MTRAYFLWITLVFLVFSWTIIVFQFVLPIKFHLLSLTSVQEAEIDRPNYLPQTQTINVKKRSYSLGNNQAETLFTLKRNKAPIIRYQRSTYDGDISSRYAGDFRRDWCRIRRVRLDWKDHLAPCAEHTRWGIKHVYRGPSPADGANSRTNAANSFIFNWDIRPAGEFSRFFIQSKTSANKTKTVGGDSWRIRVNGIASVSPTVFDHKNGTYEVLFLLMEAGLYQVQIVLDYSLCDGLKDPPVDWYKKGNIQGKNQPDGTLQANSPYLMQPFADGKPILINILKPRYSRNIQGALDRIRRIFFKQKFGEEQTLCDLGCGSLMWDGYGRWTNDTWRPFVEDFKEKQEPHKHKGVLWIYGDSVSKMFKEALETGQFYEICKRIFKLCKITYSWVYNMDGYVKEIGKEPLPDGEDYDHSKVIKEIKKVLYDKTMDEHSVILLNWGIHFAAAVNFSNFQRLINEFVDTVRFEKKQGRFKGNIIWRTTTAIFRERYPNPHKDVRRFLTFPRILLYNAYATSVMCRAGIEVLDVYPITASFPPGTLSKYDPVHYERRAFESVEALIHRKFKSNRPYS